MKRQSTIIKKLNAIRVRPTLLFTSGKRVPWFAEAKQWIRSRTGQQYQVLSSGAICRGFPKDRTRSGKSQRRERIAIRALHKVLYAD